MKFIIFLLRSLAFFYPALLFWRSPLSQWLKPRSLESRTQFRISLKGQDSLILFTAKTDLMCFSFFVATKSNALESNRKSNTMPRPQYLLKA